MDPVTTAVIAAIAAGGRLRQRRRELPPQDTQGFY